MLKWLVMSTAEGGEIASIKIVIRGTTDHFAFGLLVSHDPGSGLTKDSGDAARPMTSAKLKLSVAIIDRIAPSSSSENDCRI